MTKFRGLALLLLVAMLCPFQSASADVGMDRPNAVSVELLGRGLLYSIDYDRSISDEIGVGIGYSSWAFGDTTTDGETIAAATITMIPIYLNYYFYNSGGNRFYLTGGLDFVSAAFDIDGFKASGSNIGLIGGAGYEYRAGNGFLFRLAPYIFAVGSSAQIWGGVSLGYTF